MKPPPAATAGSRDRPSPIRRGQGTPSAVGQRPGRRSERVSRGRWSSGAAQSLPARPRLCLPGAASSGALQLPALEELRAWPGEGRASRDYCGDPAVANGAAWCGRRLRHHRWLCERRRVRGRRGWCGTGLQGYQPSREKFPSAESVFRAGLGGISHFKSFTRNSN